MRNRKFIRKSRVRSGAALVEFALIIPVIFLTFMSMIEISRAMLLQHTADSAAYEAARSVMVPGAKSSEGIAVANDLLQAAGLKSATVVVTPTVITEETPFISVNVDIPLSANHWISPFLFGSYVASSEVTLFCERPSVIQLTGVPEFKLKKAMKAAGKATKNLAKNATGANP